LGGDKKPPLIGFQWLRKGSIEGFTVLDGSDLSGNQLFFVDTLSRAVEKFKVFMIL